MWFCPYLVQLGRGGNREGKFWFGASLGTNVPGLGTPPPEHPPRSPSEMAGSCPGLTQQVPWVQSDGPTAAGNSLEEVGKGRETSWGANRRMLCPRGEGRSNQPPWAQAAGRNGRLCHAALLRLLLGRHVLPTSYTQSRRQQLTKKEYNLDKYTHSPHVTASEAKEN